MSEAMFQLPDIQEFSDCRSFFTALVALNQRVESQFSYRILAKKIGWPFSYLNDVVKGRRSLTPARALQFAKAGGFSELQTERLVYFALSETKDKSVSAYFKEKIRLETCSQRTMTIQDYSLIEEIEVAAVLEFLKWGRGQVPASELYRLLITFRDLRMDDYRRILRKLVDSGVIEEGAGGCYNVLMPRLILDESNERSGFHIHQNYARNFIRCGDALLTPRMHNSGFVEIRRDRFMRIAEKLIAVRNWLIKTGDETSAAPKTRLQETLVFQFDINLMPIIDKKEMERLQIRAETGE